MKITLTPADSSHILDIGVHPENEIYKGCQLVNDDRNESWTLINEPHYPDQITEKIREKLRGMPRNYVILQGLAPNWVRSFAQSLIQDAVGVGLLSDGRHATLMETSPPLTRSVVLAS